MPRLTAPDGVDHREDEDEDEESQNGPQPHQPRLPLDQGVGLNWPQDQSCQKGESARGHPESVHPSPSVLAPAQ